MESPEWSEELIEKYVNEGWTLSYDKSNGKYKLVKRIDGKVKSYTLPKKFNDFCIELKGEMLKGKSLGYYFKVLDKDPAFLLFDREGLTWEEVEYVLQQYCKKKARELPPEEIAWMALYAYRYITELIGPISPSERCETLELLHFKEPYPPDKTVKQVMNEWK